MQDRLNITQQLVLLALFFLLTFSLRPPQIYLDDHRDFTNWTNGIRTQGISNAFRIERFNYGPASAHIFSLFGKFVRGQLDEYSVLMRQVFFLFDLGAIFILMRYLEYNGRNAIRAFYVLFNLAFVYNALIWGQMDGVTTALIFAALVAGLVREPEIAGVLFVLAFNVKPQPIVLLPVLCLILIPTLVRQPSRIVTMFLAVAGAQLGLLIPFLRNGAWRDWIAEYANNANIFPIASMLDFIHLSE